MTPDAQMTLALGAAGMMILFGLAVLSWVSGLRPDRAPEEDPAPAGTFYSYESRTEYGPKAEEKSEPKKEATT